MRPRAGGPKACGSCWGADLAQLQGDDLEQFRPQRHLEAHDGLTLMPFGGGEDVCLGKALAELEIRLMAVGLLQRVKFRLVPDQDLSLQLIPSPSPPRRAAGDSRPQGLSEGVNSHRRGRPSIKMAAAAAPR